MDLGDFSKRIDKIADAIGTNATQAVKEVAGTVAPVLVYATPVDTSRARSNWQGSVGSPKTDILFSAPGKPPTPNDGAPIALQSIRDATARYSGEKEGIFIANNLDYIGELNDGSSTQAPRNFVEMSVDAGIRTAKSIRLIK